MNTIENRQSLKAEWLYSYVAIKLSALLLSFSLIAVGCGHPQESPRSKLVKLGKDFSPSSFIECVGNGDKEAVRLFIEAGIDVNATVDNGGTALDVATLKGDPEMMKILLDGGADPNAALTSGNSKGVTPLMGAAAGGRLEAVKMLIARRANVNAQDGQGLTAVDYAEGQTNYEILKVLWDHGAPLVTSADLTKLLNQFQFGVRAQAIRSMRAGESADTCRKLIAEQMVFFQKKQGFSTNQLIQAQVCAFRTIWDASERFVQLGTSPEKDQQAIEPFIGLCKEMQRESALQGELLSSAAAKGEADMAKWLLDNGANVNLKGIAGLTPLFCAIQTDAGGDTAKTVEVLLSAGADFNSKEGPDGMTPVMLAADSGNTRVLKLLLAKQPNVNAVNTAGRTALQLAHAGNHGEAVIMLKDAGAKE